MSKLTRALTRSTLPLLLVLCLAALSISYAFAGEAPRPLATQIIGDPDAAVTGKLAVGTATPGNKALTVVGVIDFLGAGTVHNYFTQGGGNNMQINTNVDEANTVVDATKSQWKLVMGSSLDWFSIRRSPAGATYDENALFFIEGSTGNVGIATVDTNNAGAIPFTSSAKLHVQTDTGRAVYGYTTSTSTGSGNTGVLGRSDSPTGYGAVGYAAATTGENYGVFGESDSSSGYGVYGWAAATTGTSMGVVGNADSDSGTGVVGSVSSSTGHTIGVYGHANSTDGTAVYGYAHAATGYTTGVYGQANSTDGTAVYGYAPAATGNTAGVVGSVASPDGIGVFGIASSSAVGVYGLNTSTDGWAGFFDGDLAITGTLYKTAGAFRIDHPLDPEHKYLNHSFVESPDMMNIYNGMATLDENGQAWVELPDWFEALNMDFRYQLTPIGAGMPELHIADEIQDNHFRIAGGMAGLRVSWQVTGIRHDTYAEAHRIPVEEDKPAQGLGGQGFAPAAVVIPRQPALPSAKP
jgi:hypothetical protein